MALSTIPLENEFNKFEADSNGNVCVRINQINQETIINLIETIQELSARLTVLSAVKGLNESLRITPISSVSTAVTGPQTSAQFIAAFLTSKLALENLAAVHSNIINVVGV